jgi:hypothetical protein
MSIIILEEQACYLIHARFLLGLIFNPDYEDVMLLQNTCSPQNNRKYYFSAYFIRMFEDRMLKRLAWPRMEVDKRGM